MYIVNAIPDSYIAACDAKEYANTYVDCYLKIKLKTIRLLTNKQEETSK